jgi:hypothetical protein
VIPRGLLAAALLASALSPAHAWPVLAGGKATPAGACYPDHRDPRLWWLAPPAPVVKQVGGQPAVTFTRFGYSGTKATADQGKFWGRGLLQFALAFPESAARLAQARAFLGARTRVEPITPAVVEAEVVCAATELPGGQVDLGSAGSREATAASGAAWEERSFSLSVPPHATQLLWEAFSRGAIALSVNVSAASPALPMPPEKNEEVPAPPPATVMVASVPVTLDPARNAAAFKELVLDATMAAGYTFLEVACNVFAEGAAFSDLAVVVVTVAATAVNGDALAQDVRFDASAPPVQGVRFDRAVRLDRGYRVVVHRIYASGRDETEAPRSAEVWTGFFNASRIREGAAPELDPRLLY